jgi:hypothetical protein
MVGGRPCCLPMSFDRHIEIDDREAPIRWNNDEWTNLI